MRRTVGMLLLTGVLAACAHTGPGRECVGFEAGFRFCPVPPADMGPAFERQDAVSIRTPQGAHWFIGQLELDAASFRAVGMHPGGMRLFSLAWDGSALAFDGRTDELPEPEWLLLMLQIVFAPAPALADALPRSDILDEEFADHRLRRVRAMGEERLRVRYPIDCADEPVIVEAGEVRVELSLLGNGREGAACPPAS
jgi:hypothetical protein